MGAPVVGVRVGRLHCGFLAARVGLDEEVIYK